MAVRKNQGVALGFALTVALVALCECAICPRAEAQESSDTNQDGISTVEKVSDLSDARIEPTDRPATERKVERSDEPGRRSDPVFQEQTTPPSQPTMAEKTSPLLERSKKEPASNKVETTQPPPPKPVEERRPPAPHVNYIWVPGFWYWYNVQYFWIPGQWIAPRPGFIFVRPRWTRRAGVWVFLPGGWAVAGGGSIVYPFDIGVFVRPWLRPRRYHRHRGHFARPHRSGRAFRPPKGRRPRARITTRRATQPRTRARQR